jgi:Glyoxalase-like domain
MTGELASPVPTIDHVVVNVRDRIEEGAATYRRLGFTLTPRGYHSLGSMNHLAIFGTDYLELIAVPAGNTSRSEIMSAPQGLNGLVFASEDAAATHAALDAAGVAAHLPLQFTRPVALPDGAKDATFRTVHLASRESGLGRLYFCQHLTRDLVWRDEWRHHANGALGLARAVIAARDPGPLGALFALMFGAAAVRPIEGGCTLATGLARFDIVTPDAVAAQFGDTAPDGDGRAEYMAALTLRTLSLDVAARALAGIAGIRREAGRLIVPASQAFGTVLEFVAVP